ncbi:Uncharacterized protein C1orf101 [Exaiptasia diaphana]|nr:Uncharacterized protein C1orf101 [Exaiptasia diaphana]
MAKESWRSKTSLLHCKQAGLHAISPVKNASMVRYINVVHSPFCYEWYLAHHRIITDETTDTFRVWIVDPLHSSSEEENQTAVLPSSFSAQLSTIFNKFGQEPFINLRSGYRSIPSPINTISKGFNSNTSCWEFIMEEPIVDTQLTVWITGKSIAFHDCFISSSFVITQDNFKTTSQVYIPTGLLQGSDPVVVDTAFSTNGNLLLMLKSSIVLVYDTMLQRFSKSSGLTSGTDSGLARILPSSTGCSSDTNHEIDTIAWSNSMLILEVVFHPFYQSYFFLVHDSNDSKNQLAVLEYIDGASLWRQHVLNFTKYTAEFFSTDDFMCKPMRIVGETVIREVEEDRNSTSTNTLKSLKNIHTFVA